MSLRARKRIRKHGWTPPGYDFMGPGNDIDFAPPRNWNDRVSKDHDIEYGVQEKIHKSNPKYYYNDADEKFIKHIGGNGWGMIAKNVFKAKKWLAERGVIGDKRTRTDDISPPEKMKKRRWDQEANKKRNFDQVSSSLQFTPNKERRFNEPGRQEVFGMATPQGSGNDAGLKETPIDQVAHDVHRGPKDYVFASLPYYQTRHNAAFVNNFDLTYRMTSPLDCYIAPSWSDVNTGAGTQSNTIYVSDATDVAASTGVDKSRWFDFYASIYKYYAVVGCRWNLIAENLGSQPVYLHQMYYTDTLPPTGATNDDIKTWPGVQTHYLGTHGVSITSTGSIEQSEANNTDTQMTEDNPVATSNINYETGNMITRKTLSPMVSMSGNYQPGDFTRQIRQDATVETWTAVAANPALSERLLFRLKPTSEVQYSNNALSSDANINVRWVYECEYLVEFKELKDGLKYPVQRQPMVVTIGQSTTSSTL